MTARTRTLQAELRTVEAAGIAARTLVALPPSTLDPATVLGGTSYDATTVYDSSTVYTAVLTYELMRVYSGGSLVLRAYDSEVA